MYLSDITDKLRVAEVKVNLEAKRVPKKGWILALNKR